MLQQLTRDLVSLKFSMKALCFMFFEGPRRVFTSRALSPRRGGHAVRVWRRGRSAGLNVDGRHNVSGNAPAHSTKMTLLPYIFIGTVHIGFIILYVGSEHLLHYGFLNKPKAA